MNLTKEFYWISKIFSDLSEQTINSIWEEIKEDIDSNKDNEIQIECFFKKYWTIVWKIKETGYLY